MARAKRVETNGLGPRDVPCPHCGAPPFVSVNRDPGYCRTYPAGTYGLWNPLPRHADHKRRVEEAERLKTRILREGEGAARELARLKKKGIRA